MTARAARMPSKPRRKKEAVEYPPLPPDAILMTLDASSSAIGWSVWVGGKIRAADVIKSPQSWDKVRRMRANAEAVIQLIEQYRVTNVVMEFQSHKSAGGSFTAQGLATLGQAQGYLLALIDLCCPDVIVETPSERDWTRWGGRNLAKISRARIVAAHVPEYAELVRVNAKVDGGYDLCDAVGIGLWRLGVVK